MNMRNRNRRWLVAWMLASLFSHVILYEIVTEYRDNSSGPKEPRGILAPRMNYEQWIPLGRGDPLKNDPTYDYVPPVLDTVHYWIDPASRKPDAPLPGETPKTEILVLGVSSKKPSIGTSITADSRKDIYDPFLKFVEGPKLGIQNNYQRMSRPHYTMSSYYPSPFETKHTESEMYFMKGDPHVPYTVLMPPPVPLKRPEIINFQQALNSLTTTEYPSSTISNSITSDTPSITIQQANLLYHSSTFGNQDEFRGKSQLGSIGASSSRVTWRTPLSNPSDSNDFQKSHQLKKPELLMENMNKIRGLPNNNNNLTGNMDFKELPIIIGENSYVMHKGQVTDGDMGIANTYVNIGKPEAQVHSPNDMEISNVSIEPPQLTNGQPSVLAIPSTSSQATNTLTSFILKPQITPMTLQTLQTMQTMKAPPISQSPKFIKKTTSSLQHLLQNEVTSNFIPTPFTKMPTDVSSNKDSVQSITTVLPPTTSTVISLTTDPLFKHYKQPTEPLKGPLYLIIQGHSKVKTYGPGKQIHGIAVQETNEIPTSDDRDEYGVKHLHGYKKDSNEGRLRQGRSNDLQTLSHVVQTGLGAIKFSEPVVKRKKGDVQEAEFVVKYDVSSQTDNVGERYYKGIVEAGDVARNIKVGRKQQNFVIL